MSRVVSILNEIFGFSRSYDSGDSAVQYNCPHCDKGRNKFNLSISLEKQIFHCWSCHYKGRVSKLLYDFGSANHKELYFSEQKIQKPKKLEPVLEPINIGPVRSMKHDWGSIHYLNAKAYLNKRGINQAMIEKWDMCYAEKGPNANRIIIPTKSENNELEFFLARSFYDYVKPKYRNPKTPKYDMIFGEQLVDWNKTVVLTEGIFDSIILWNSVPCLGTDLVPYQKLVQKIVDNDTPIIIAFDRDAWAKARIAYKHLEDLGVNVKIVKHEKVNDLSDGYELYGKEYIVDLLKSATTISELDHLF